MLHNFFGKKFVTVITAVTVLLATGSIAAAAEVIPAMDSSSKSFFAVGAMIAAAFSIGVGAVGAAIGIGNAANGACQAVGRNPGVQGKIMMTMLVGMAMAESIAIYCLVISLVLLFANPFVSYFLG